MKFRILCVRHGRPTLRYADSPWEWMAAGRLNQLLDAYDDAGLLAEWNAARRGDPVDWPALSSDLPRALETAALLSGRPQEEIEQTPLLREVPLGRYRNESLRLPLALLLGGVRLGWLTGWADCAERRPETLARVRKAADLAEERAIREGRLALYSHGFFLWLLGSELRRRGWRTEKRGPYRYLERALFVRE